MKTWILVVIILLISLNLIYGCGKIAPTPTLIAETPELSTKAITPFSITTYTPDRIMPTLPSATATLRFTSLPTFTPSVTYSLTPSRTPRPTLPKDQAQALAQKLRQTNGDCLLPCWWGITPGKTTWEDANSFLKTLDSNILHLDPDTYGVTVRFPEKAYKYPVIGGTFFIENEIIESMRIQVDLPLHALFTKYGAPDKIYIKARGYILAHDVGWFTLILFYESQGILAVYNGITNKGPIVGICPVNITEPPSPWYLWNPVNPKSFAEIAKIMLLISNYPPPSIDDYPSIEELTKIDILTFYKTYKESRNAIVCLEVPAGDV